MNIDEIKKGLECCSNLSIRCCIDCPYNNDKDWLDCDAEKMHKDALNLINELEKENELLRGVKNEKNNLW